MPKFRVRAYNAMSGKQLYEHYIEADDEADALKFLQEDLLFLEADEVGQGDEDQEDNDGSAQG